MVCLEVKRVFGLKQATFDDNSEKKLLRRCSVAFDMRFNCMASFMSTAPIKRLIYRKVVESRTKMPIFR